MWKREKSVWLGAEEKAKEEEKCVWEKRKDRINKNKEWLTYQTESVSRNLYFRVICHSLQLIAANVANVSSLN